MSPITIDLNSYHHSIEHEFQVYQDRMRNLIGNAHWLTDGEHKESVLRRVLGQHLSEDTRVGSGFVISADGGETRVSHQIDILCTDRAFPTLYKENNLTIVTADAVRAIIEVKTEIHSETRLLEILSKLCDDAEMIRRGKSKGDTLSNPYLWVGLFVYEPSHGIKAETLLACLRDASGGDPDRVINAVALGPQLLARFWYTGAREMSWTSHNMENVHAYFISQAVWSLSAERSQSHQEIWFPGGMRSWANRQMSLDGKIDKPLD